MSETLQGLEELFGEFSKSFEQLWEIVEQQLGSDYGNINVQQRKLIAETAIILHELLSKAELDSPDIDFGLSWIHAFSHILSREFEGNFILRFHYFQKNYGENPGRAVQGLISTVLALHAIETIGPKLNRESTVWKYLERDLPGFRKALSDSIAKSGKDGAANELFLLLNVIELLDAIKDSKIVIRELDHFRDLAKDSQVIFNRSFEISPGLRLYAEDLRIRLGLQIDPGSLPTDPEGKNAAFLALSLLRRGVSPSSKLLAEAKRPPSYHLWWLANAWHLRLGGQRRLGILPFYRRLDIEAVFRIVWGNPKDLLHVNMSKDETDKVTRLNGREIKTQLYRFFSQHKLVTDWSRTRLSSERDKPDAGGEISDFNVEIQGTADKIWIAIPIKSGREIGSRTREKIEQDFLYQFIRPLVVFEKNEVVVFPIILTQFTLNSNEFLSLLRARLRLPIMVLDTEIYARLIKRENLTT